jgi:sulfur relay (sulfurtransferase) complex TusBCD TusD component (DsrE family)
MKLGIVLSQTQPETFFNVLRLANYSLKHGDTVRIFLLGQGVEIDGIMDPKFDVAGHAKAFLAAGGQFLACGTCLQLRDSKGSEICPVSSLKDLYELVHVSDRLLTF